MDKVTVPYVEVCDVDTKDVSWFALPALMSGSEGRVSLQHNWGSSSVWDRLATTKSWLEGMDVTFLRGADIPEFEIGMKK